MCKPQLRNTGSIMSAARQPAVYRRGNNINDIQLASAPPLHAAAMGTSLPDHCTVHLNQRLCAPWIEADDEGLFADVASAWV